MSIQLKIDTAALISLFPEGSEVRLELQQAVINEVSRNIIDRNVSALNAQVKAACLAHFERVLATEGIKHAYNGWQLSEPVKTAIGDQVKSLFSKEVSKAIDAVAQPALDEIRRKLDAQLETGLRARLDALAREALRGALK